MLNRIKILKGHIKKALGGHTFQEEVVNSEFDRGYYLSCYNDVKKSGENPLKHYMRKGWKEGKNPNTYFNTISYLLCNPDVFNAGINPLFHFISYGRREGRPGINEQDAVKKYFGNNIYEATQDITFPLVLEKTKKIMVIVVPEDATMSGGIYSMYSIANIAYRLKSGHDYEIVLMTRPNSDRITHCRQHNFRNSEDVYRFEQIVRCQSVKELYLHIPEYATADFVDNLSEEALGHLKSVDKLYVNILNQNAELMPEKNKFIKLRDLADELTQSVAHHAYFNQKLTNKYDLPTLLLPAYTDLSAYTPSTFEKKERLIIYSLDDAPHKEKCLKLLRDKLPNFEFKEIKGITFDQFMDYATKCMFSISFGEGFDGYIAQPIYQGGIGLTVYNDDYFPSKDFLKFDNFFETEKQMLNQIIDRINYYSNNKKAYTDLNTALIAEYDKLYQFDDYVSKVNALIIRQFDLFPKGPVPSGGLYRV